MLTEIQKAKFPVGTSVNVNEKPGCGFLNDFTGVINDITDDKFIVEDMDGDLFQVDFDQLERLYDERQ